MYCRFYKFSIKAVGKSVLRKRGVGRAARLFTNTKLCILIDDEKR